MFTAKYDYLIIGQGLAGSLLAFCLIKRGMRVLVLDDQHYQCASKVAAGIINPITGHRLKVSEGFDDYYPCAVKFYTDLENTLNAKVFKAIDQHRLIIDQQQLAHYRQCRQQIEYRHFLGRRVGAISPSTYTKFGAVEVSQSALLNTKVLLAASKNWLQSLSSYRSTKVDYHAFEITENGFTIDGATGKNVFFCEGHQAIYNPWLKNLPFKLTKGEILTVELQRQSPAQMLNWGNWLLPTARDRIVKLGSNYVWDDLCLTPHSETETKLLSSLRQFTNLAAKTVTTEVGIRPTALRRKPFVGPINTLRNAYCFNGFGSKGCLLIPYYAELMCDLLIKQTPLPNEVTKWL